MYQIGCAGWSLSSTDAALITRSEGSLLERYASTFNAVEINSSFYRHHQPKTYQRWAQVVPEDFRFAVKVPRAITHEARLDAEESQATLQRFLEECRALEHKLGPLLVQLPPNLYFSFAVAKAFFADLRRRHAGAVVVEPRHSTWFSPKVDALFKHFDLGRVIADPAVTPAGKAPGGAPGAVVYMRLHGQPKIYFSPYEHSALEAFAKILREAPTTDERWCVFDNTAAGHAVVNAWEMKELLIGRRIARTEDYRPLLHLGTNRADKKVMSVKE